MVLCLLLIFTCFLSSCGKASGEENPTVIKSDLTIEALRDILVEKGDDIRFSGGVFLCHFVDTCSAAAVSYQ